MLIKEYRIAMPMSVAEYRIAQLYMIQKKSREESQGEGSGVEIIENRPYEDGPGGGGQYTRKIYHISKHIPSWFVAILPKDALIVYEEAWNAYPHTRTRYTCPFIDKFSIDIETKYFDDPGDRNDVFEYTTTTPRQKSVDVIDIVMEQSGDLRKDEDPRLFKSTKTGRGPLSDDWLQQARDNLGKEGCKVMCSYKLCKVEFKYWGMQSKIERFIHDVALRRTMVRAHRQAWCWQDEWVGLNMEDIRRLERETQAELEKKFGGDLTLTVESSQDEEQDMTENDEVSLPPINNQIKENGEMSEANNRGTIESPTQAAKKKHLVRQVSASSQWSNHSKAGSGKSLPPGMAGWRMQSIERHSDQSSDEDEFFDAHDNLDIEAKNNNLHSLQKWSSVDSLVEDKREAFEKLGGADNIDPSVAYQISVEDDNFNQPSSPYFMMEKCKVDVLFLVLHGGNPVDANTDGGLNISTKQADVNTLSTSFDTVVASHYKSAAGRFAFRLVSCPPVCLDAFNALKILSPLGYDNSASHQFSSALVSAHATYSPQYLEAINLTFASCNSAYHAFTLSNEGKNFNGQVCIIADSVGSLIVYDMLTTISNHKRSNSQASSRRGSALTTHEEEEGPLSNSLPSSPNLRFSFNISETNPMIAQGLLKDPPAPDFDPLKLPAPSMGNRRYSANYCLDVQKSMVSLPGQTMLPRRSSSSFSLEGSHKLEFEVADVFFLGTPLGVILALRNAISGNLEAPLRPACGRIYNTFYLADPTSCRLEPLLESRFSRIPVVDVARYHQFPLGDGRSLSLGDTITSNMDMFLDPGTKCTRRGSEWSVTSYNGEGLNSNSVNQKMECCHDDHHNERTAKEEDALLDEVASCWFGDQRLDFALFCPESLSSFPSVSLPHLFYASFWESNDLAAFIIRQVVHHETVAVCLDCDKEVVSFSPSIPKEKWLRRRTQVKLRNMTSNHRSKDCVAIENGEQVLSGRFTYGPLDVVTLTGEKVDVYVNTMTSSQEWKHVGTEIADSHGKISCSLPQDKRLPLGIFPLKMVVRGDLTTADSYLAVVPPHTDCVIFSIDGSFAASVSLMGSDPKVRPGSVDVVRHWQEQGYLIIYVTARPDMQKHRVVTWLAHHNFPHGPIYFSDGLSHDPLKLKTNLLKQLQMECQLNFVGGYGSSKDIIVYSQLNLTSDKIYIIGKISKKQTHQCQWLSDGYAIHLRELKAVLKPAKYNAQIIMRKGCFGLPGHQSHSKNKRSSGKRSGSMLGHTRVNTKTSLIEHKDTLE